MTKDELEADARLIAGAEIEDLPVPVIEAILTTGQYITDRCLAELEKRGSLEYRDGAPVVPYRSDHAVESPLTRPLQ